MTPRPPRSTLSLHDALPICPPARLRRAGEDHHGRRVRPLVCPDQRPWPAACRPPHLLRRPYRPRRRSEEHTSELQSHSDLVCRLLLEKKKKKYTTASIQNQQ